MSDRAQALVAGATIGHYEVLSKLGAGGMGEVFLGRDTKLDRNVAIKVLPSEFSRDSGRLRRFELEAKALAALSHPNIVSVFSVEEHNGLHLLVMEFVEGRTLREIIPASGMPMPQFLDIAVSLTDAIKAAHARGVTHRDLKPENIMITDSGWVKVLDFGLVKFRALPEPSRVTKRGLFEPDLTTMGVLLGTGAVHVARAGRGPANRSAIGSVLAGLGVLRNADGHPAVSRPLGRASPQLDSAGRARTHADQPRRPRARARCARVAVPEEGAR